MVIIICVDRSVFITTVCPPILLHGVIWRGLPVCRYTSRNSGMQQRFHFLPEKAVGAKSCLKYFSENHTMVEFEINTPRSNKILPSVLPKYSSRRREYFGRTRGSILLLRGVFIKIFIEWWSRKTPRRQPRGFSCHHEMNIAPN